tara:strand:- start:2337 stop:2618 length:282 start_codon:yes stop_codon:yes gene_type:complete
MYYRLQVGTVDGIECGYQWREIDIALFTSIGTGAKPEGDAEAQTRDSTEENTAGQNRTMYYLAVWNQDINDWTNSITDPATDYEAWGLDAPGA